MPASHACRICDHRSLEPVLDLGEQPWANHFLPPEEVGTEPSYPLRLVFCPRCRGAQLDFTVPKEVMFSDHTYVSGTTRTLREHFAALARRTDSRFFASAADKSFLDIGSNDGTQLEVYRELGFRVLGVESCEPVARLAQAAGLPTVIDFFDLRSARGLGRIFDLINASGVFFHLEDLHPVTEGIRICLGERGIFQVQFLYVPSILGNTAFDQIYHEHLLYFSLKSLRAVLERHGLEPFDAHWSAIHGGSMVVLAGHRGAFDPSRQLAELEALEESRGSNELGTYRRFAGRVDRLRRETLSLLRDRRGRGRSVYGMGAPVKGNTLLNSFSVDRSLIQLLVEKNPLRDGLVAPGSHIPVVMEDDLEAPPDTYFVLAWNFRKEILANNAHLLDQGVEFHFPIEPAQGWV